MGPFNGLTGDPELDRDIVEEHQRRYLEETQAEEIAEGDRAALEDGYQPINDGDDDFIDTRDDNRLIGND